MADSHDPRTGGDPQGPVPPYGQYGADQQGGATTVSYTHLTLPTNREV